VVFWRQKKRRPEHPTLKKVTTQPAAFKLGSRQSGGGSSKKEQVSGRGGGARKKGHPKGESVDLLDRTWKSLRVRETPLQRANVTSPICAPYRPGERARRHSKKKCYIVRGSNNREEWRGEGEAKTMAARVYTDKKKIGACPSNVTVLEFNGDRGGSVRQGKGKGQGSKGRKPAMKQAFELRIRKPQIWLSG